MVTIQKSYTQEILIQINLVIKLRTVLRKLLQLNYKPKEFLCDTIHKFICSEGKKMARKLNETIYYCD